MQALTIRKHLLTYESLVSEIDFRPVSFLDTL